MVAPGVHRLATRYENWYVLEAGGRLTTLDSGLPGHWREFFAALSRLGYALSDIDAVVITHHHPDHAGNAERLRSQGARVLAHGGRAPRLSRRLVQGPRRRRSRQAACHEVRWDNRTLFIHKTEQRSDKVA